MCLYAVYVSMHVSVYVYTVIYLQYVLFMNVCKYLLSEIRLKDLRTLTGNHQKMKEAQKKVLTEIVNCLSLKTKDLRIRNFSVKIVHLV